MIHIQHLYNPLDALLAHTAQPEQEAITSHIYCPSQQQVQNCHSAKESRKMALACKYLKHIQPRTAFCYRSLRESFTNMSKRVWKTEISVIAEDSHCEMSKTGIKCAWREEETIRLQHWQHDFLFERQIWQQSCGFWFNLWPGSSWRWVCCLPREVSLFIVLSSLLSLQLPQQKQDFSLF